MTDSKPSTHSQSPSERRTFLAKASGLTMAGGLLAGYGTFAHVAGRFLYPAREPDTSWLYVAVAREVAPGSSLVFRSPGGAKITIARRSEEEGGEFIALSSICPHLGCQVHWQKEKGQFFCPCHNGVFDAGGKALKGPPADSGQSLSTFPLKEENGLLYIGIREEMADGADGLGTVEEPGGPTGPGHDPVLFERREV